MSMEVRFPNITETSERGQLQQIKSYLHQLVEQLNFALSNVETEARVAAKSVASSAASSSKEEDTQASFNSIKSLIIKSADIVEAYYDIINSRLEGIYVAQSDFGTYSEETAQEIEANSTSIEALYTNLQRIITDIENVENSLIEVNAHIRSGLLYYDENGAPVYGLEVGQKNVIDGEEVFNKFARFTADKLSFYDQNGNEVAYISDKKLYITHVEVISSFSLGGFVETVLANRSVVKKWIG